MRKGHKKGFLLVEALISIFILIMVATTGISLVIYGYRAINFNKHSLEASWLAQEGANSFRGIRDTNWLRFSYDKAGCWNIIGDDCATGTPIFAGNYILQGSRLVPKSDNMPLDLSGGVTPSQEEYQLYYLIDDQGNSFVDHLYTSPLLPTFISIEESKFFRSIEVTNATADTIEAICTVQWLEGSQVEEISLPVTLTNYLLET